MRSALRDLIVIGVVLAACTRRERTLEEELAVLEMSCEDAVPRGLEKLVTDLALKTREIRTLEGAQRRD